MSTPLYFELSAEERTALQQNKLISGEERFLLWDLNHGRRMMNVLFEGYDTLADGLVSIAPVTENEDRFDVYRDAIACLLLAAAFEQLETHGIVQEAVELQRRMLRDACEGAERLRGAGHDKA